MKTDQFERDSDYGYSGNPGDLRHVPTEVLRKRARLLTVAYPKALRAVLKELRRREG